MPLQIRDLVPMVHVADVSASVEFYRRFGFEVVNSFRPEGAAALQWARLELGATRLMLNRADGPVDAGQQAVLFYLYFDDTRSAHAELAGKGIRVGPITFPFWAPQGEFRMEDPDGYVLMAMHT